MLQKQPTYALHPVGLINVPTGDVQNTTFASCVCKYMCGIKGEAEKTSTREGFVTLEPSLLRHGFSCQTLYSTLSSAKAEVLQCQNTQETATKNGHFSSDTNTHPATRRQFCRLWHYC